MDLPDDSLEWRRKTASDPQSSAETLRMLAEDEDEQVRRSLAGHENCPPDLLKQFAFGPDDEIRRIVASNPACLHELLQRLFGLLVFVDLELLVEPQRKTERLCRWRGMPRGRHGQSLAPGVAARLHGSGDH